jgi:lipoprotein-anchoring transpeptidase ErfK/SrfK
MAYEGSTKIYEFLISSGKWGKTPTGDFNIWIKLNATRMTGGDKALGTFYDLPNVPYTMYFYNKDVPKTKGYGIHGAYWHNNFGHPMSHGCINLSVADAKTLYEWTNPPSTDFATYVDDNNPATPIYIFGTAPLE